MKLEDQVCSLELSKRLRELGVKKRGLFFWSNMQAKPSLEFWRYGDEAQPNEYAFFAYTVAELGVLLPAYIDVEGVRPWELVIEKWTDSEWHIAYLEPDGYDGGEYKYSFEGSEANARAEMLCNLIEHGLLKL